MGSFDLKWALAKIEKLDPDEKFNTMLMTAAILTKLLELEQVKPIIVNGFSWAIYTDESYTTRDIKYMI